MVSRYQGVRCVEDRRVHVSNRSLRESAMDRLERSNTDKLIFGVGGGLAANLDVDPVLVRIVFVILGIATGGTAVIGYLLLAILMPPSLAQSDEDSDAEGTESKPSNQTSENLEKLKQEAREATERLRAAVSRHSPGSATASSAKKTWGLIAIVLGGLLLGSNLGWYGWFSLGEWWPVIVIAGGVALIATSQRGDAD